MGFPGGSQVNNLPAMQETVDSIPGWGRSGERRHATHFSILVWRIPWTEEPEELQSTGPQRVGHDQSALAQIFFTKPDQFLKRQFDSSNSRNLNFSAAWYQKLP